MTSREGGSWVTWKESAKEAYENGNYEEATKRYENALDPVRECPQYERKILYSNIVACRLHLVGQGKREQLDKALSDAQTCLSLDPQWSKGHVRLASVYSAMGRSNDACNSLQTALRLDPNNRTARQMLVQELRRDHSSNFRTTGTSTSTGANTYSDDLDESTATSEFRAQAAGTFNSILHRIQESYRQTMVWYSRQSSDTKTAIRILLGLLVLYVAFGGRFGFESRPVQHGNYDTRDNAYQKYYARNSDPYRRDYYYEQPRAQNYYGSSGFPFQIIPLLLIAYICHLNGINPLYGIFMMNRIGGRRHHFGMGGMHMGAFGPMGFGGFGRFGRRRAAHRRF